MLYLVWSFLSFCRLKFNTSQAIYTNKVFRSCEPELTINFALNWLTTERWQETLARIRPDRSHGGLFLSRWFFFIRSRLALLIFIKLNLASSSAARAFQIRHATLIIIPHCAKVSPPSSVLINNSFLTKRKGIPCNYPETGLCCRRGNLSLWSGQGNPLRVQFRVESRIKFTGKSLDKSHLSEGRLLCNDAVEKCPTFLTLSSKQRTGEIF